LEVKLLKRYQVLLPDWLEDYVKYLTEKYDLSFSEVIRAEVCGSILSSVSKLFPDYKPGLTLGDIFQKIKRDKFEKLKREDIHRILSTLYFEARKAAEFRMKQEKKQVKKKR